MTRATKTWIACMVGGLTIAIFIGTSTNFRAVNIELNELVEQYKRESEFFESQLTKARSGLARTEDLLANSREDLERSQVRIIRSEILAGELSGVLSTLSTGSTEIDDLIGAIRKDIEAIIRELSGVSAGSGTADP